MRREPDAVTVLGVVVLLVLASLVAGTWWLQRRDRAEVELETAARTRSAAIEAARGAPASRIGVADAERVEASPESRATMPSVKVSVAGRVVDTDGTPQAEVRVRFAQMHERPGITVATGADGRFAFPAPMATGEWRVFIDRDRTLVRPEAVTVGAQAEAFVEVVVARDDPAQQIRGSVVDESGRPVAGAELSARTLGEGLAGHGRSQRDGIFVVRRQPAPGEQPRSVLATTSVRLGVVAAGFEDSENETRHAWGERDVVLTLRRAVQCSLRVVAADTRQPVEAFRLSVVSTRHAGRGQRWGSRHDGRFPGGLVQFDAKRRGPHQALVAPEDPTLGISDWVEFTVGDTMPEPVVVEVPRVVPLHVMVVTGDGQPIVGSHVELVRQERPEVWQLDAWAVTFASMRSTSFDGQCMLQLGEGSTDGAGRVTLAIAPSQASQGVRVLGPGHVPVFVQPVVPTADSEELRIVVAAGATLVGTLTPATVLAALQRFVPARSPGLREAPGLRLLRRDAGDPRQLPARGRMTPDAEGRFRWTGVPAGTWALLLEWDEVSSDQTLFASSASELEVVRDLRNGETRELRHDITALTPASLAGSVFLDGQPLRRSRVWLFAMALTDSGKRDRVGLPVRTDDAGRFTVPALRPGTWLLAADTRDATTGRELQVFGRERVTLAPGEAGAHTFTLERQRARIRLLAERDAQPLPAHTLSLRGPDGSLVVELVTDGEGWVTLDPVPPGPLHASALRVGVTREQVRAAPVDQAAALSADLGTIELPQGRSEGTFTLRVPQRE